MRVVEFFEEHGSFELFRHCRKRICDTGHRYEHNRGNSTRSGGLDVMHADGVFREVSGGGKERKGMDVDIDIHGRYMYVYSTLTSAKLRCECPLLKHFIHHG